jgi:hypothetical protein
MRRDARRACPGDSDLQSIPGIGPSMSEDLRDLGYGAVEDLADADPEEMYRRLCELRGTRLDRCVLYVFRCAAYYAASEHHDPELLKWWNWKDDPALRRGARKRS